MDIKKTLLKKLNVIKFFIAINGQEKTLKYMQIKRKTGAYTLYECYMDVKKNVVIERMSFTPTIISRHQSKAIFE